MKHQWHTTALLILIFTLSQLVGLIIVSQYIDIEQSAASGSTVINEEHYVLDPPEVTDNTWSFIPILFAILIGTGIVLLLVKFQKTNIWKTWFFLSMNIALFFALYPFVHHFLVTGTATLITLFMSSTLAWLKTYKSSLILHNVTELLVYGGIAALLVPMLNIYAAIILLILISVYDAYAVWKSKHMVSMATFQAQSNVFAGLYIPKDAQNQTKTIPKIHMGESHPVKTKTSPKKATQSSGYALLGGGDIAFPLLFAASVLKMTNDYFFVGLVVLGSILGLTALFVFSKPNKFYPAMPMITTGLFAGFIIGLLFLL